MLPSAREPHGASQVNHLLATRADGPTRRRSYGLDAVLAYVVENIWLRVPGTGCQFLTRIQGDARSQVPAWLTRANYRPEVAPVPADANARCHDSPASRDATLALGDGHKATEASDSAADGPGRLGHARLAALRQTAGAVRPSAPCASDPTARWLKSAGKQPPASHRHRAQGMDPALAAIPDPSA